MSGKRLIDDINDSEKKLSISFIKSKTKFCLSLHCNSEGSYLYVNKIEICIFKGVDNIHPYSFCSGKVSF